MKPPSEEAEIYKGVCDLGKGECDLGNLTSSGSDGMGNGSFKEGLEHSKADIVRVFLDFQQADQ